MPRIAKCDKCGKEKEMLMVFLGDAMPNDFVMFQEGYLYGKVFCDKCMKEIDAFFKK